MQHLGLLYLLLILLTNLWGLTLITGFFLPNRWAAISCGPWIGVTAFFAIESHGGLGEITGVGSIGTVISFGLIWLSSVSWSPLSLKPRALAALGSWRQEFAPKRLWDCGAVLVLIFLYAFVWRYATPNLDGSSEKIADLAYIASYFTGHTIPVPDVWYFPHLSTQYYSFQYYAAALAGRSLGWPLGTTYNVSYCLLVGFTGVSFAGAVFLLARRWWVRIFLLFALFGSGSGVSGFVHFVFKNPQLWNTVRFIGIDVPYDGTPAGPFLTEYRTKFKRLELPGEAFAYTATLGDYHPPLSGYYLLGVGVVAAALAQQTGRRRYAAMVGATLTWSLLANTWTFPLQLAGVGGWALFHWRQWKTLWPAIIGGAVVVWLATAVYLNLFAAAAGDYKTAIRLVKAGDHTPPLFFVMFLWPTIVLSVLAFYSRSRGLILLGLGGLGFLFLSEFIFIDDVYVVEFERFNTTLKWWPWIVAAVLLVVAPPLLDQPRRAWIRIVAILTCGIPCVFAYDLADYWFHTDHSSMGRLEGDAFLRKNDRARVVLTRLKVEPYGVVIERPNKDSFTNSAVLPIFALKQMWIGWMGHELLWRGYTDEIRQRQDRLMQFFKGEMTDPVNWLSGEPIDYVLWYQDEDTNELWTKLDHELHERYRWVELFSAPDGRKTGFWRRNGVFAKP